MVPEDCLQDGKRRQCVDVSKKNSREKSSSPEEDTEVLAFSSSIISPVSCMRELSVKGVSGCARASRTRSRNQTEEEQQFHPDTLREKLEYERATNQVLRSEIQVLACSCAHNKSYLLSFRL